MTVKRPVHLEVNINIVKIEKSKFEDLLNDCDIVFGIIDGELEKLIVREDEDGISLIEYKLQEKIYPLDFVYKFV